VTGCAEVSIDPTAQVHPTAIVGSPYRRLLDGRRLSIDRGTTIGAGAWIGPYASIGQGATLGAGSILEEYVGIQPLSVIGTRVLMTSRSWIGLGVTVGNDCVIKGHIGDNSRIGDGCRVAGDLIHRQIDPTIPWDDPVAEEPAPVVGDGAFIGWRAVVVGGVNIGAGAYVCSQALITKDVPAGYIASGRNEIMPPDKWRGALGKSPFFGEPHDNKLADSRGLGDPTHW
jgi:UDP-3-O-[3-hydroxymyristoyl] glucosamine N-acyltransferase